ncbi:MAG: PIN domain-containing protein [Deltaproteobacteria bacterium]|nr:PIN domain-containing protein [Deltaproteobacteria bacterium]
MNFADTNVLVYAVDAAEPRRQRLARDLIEAEAATLVVSTQVLVEFYAAATRRLKMRKEDARKHLQNFARLRVVPTDSTLVLGASDIHQLNEVSWFDALIIRSASVAGCTVLYSEDLADGAVYEGVRVLNPFGRAAGA